MTLVLPAAAFAQPVRVGSEFQVNSYTPNSQSSPEVATDSDGDFVVAWHSIGQDGSIRGVFAQRFDSAGVRQGTEFQVNSYTNMKQDYVAVAMDGDGDFVVAWSSYTQDGLGSGVFARRFNSAGGPQAVEFQVNSYTPNSQENPAVAMDSDGDFVVAWSSYPTQDGLGSGVFARRFNSAGGPQAVEFRVNSYTPSDQTRPAVGMDDAGDFVVVWNSSGQDGSMNGVFARRFSSAGSPQANEFQVNSHTASHQFEFGTAVAPDSDGDFVVAWVSTGQDGSVSGVFARRFSSAGTPQATEFQVNAYTTAGQTLASVAMDGDGDFVVSWDSYGHDGSTYGVFARRFDAGGSPQATEFQVNSFTAGSQGVSAVATVGGGDFVVAWRSSGQDGYAYGIFAQRFALAAAGPVLDIDGNGPVDALTDTLLFLRYAFGFRGAVLVAGAVGGGCTRCDAASIEAYIASIFNPQLDVDGNGPTDALTDALLGLRYVFGFRGAVLITGAVGGSCTRCTAPEIEAYIASLVA